VKKEIPEKAEERIESREKRDAEADVTDGVNGERIGNGPEAPARIARGLGAGRGERPARMELAPRMRAGRLQRARKTPTTMTREMTIGERPRVTSLVGASARLARLRR